MTIKPLGNRVLVKPEEEEKVTASGIVLPDTADKEKKAQGEIIALGEGDLLAKLNLKPGMKVLFKKWGGEDVEIDNQEYKILDQADIIAVIEK